MGNGKNLKRFSLDASHFHTMRTHWHPWYSKTTDIGPFLQQPLDRRSRHMPFDHIPLNISGVARSVLRADTALFLHCIYGLGDMVINTKSRGGDVGSPLRSAAATR